MKQTQTQKFYLGLFIILSTILLVIALYIIGNRQNIFGKSFKISAVFKNVNGLQKGNNVRYSGLNAGTVKNIIMVNDTTICVDMLLEEKFLNHLKKNAVAAIGSDGLVGSMVINIVPGTGFAQNIFNGDTIKSFSKISTNDMLETLNTTNENAAILTSDLLKITTAINQGKGTLGMLIQDSEIASSLKQSVINLKTITANTSKTMLDLKNIVEAINYNESVAAVLLSDSVTANNLKQTISNLEISSNKVNAVLDSLNGTINQIKNSKGTLNYVLTDTVLVQTIDETLLNIKEGSVRLNENLEALKHNIFFRGYFKKLEREKNREQNN
jgi:phospholipid/cholesterol/gamma-HCH transport system substrate-binding protein